MKEQNEDNKKKLELKAKKMLRFIFDLESIELNAYNMFKAFQDRIHVNDDDMDQQDLLENRFDANYAHLMNNLRTLARKFELSESYGLPGTFLRDEEIVQRYVEFHSMSPEEKLLSVITGKSSVKQELDGDHEGAEEE